jgi:hypothetical protein
MQNEKSFDLNHAIQNWRENLANLPAFRGENIDELESHLRDSIAALESRGLSPSETFQIAAQRVGGIAGLECEFSKVNKRAIWLDRVFWMLIGYQVWNFVSGIVHVIAQNAVIFGLSGLGHGFKRAFDWPFVVLLTVAQLAGFAGSLALCWWAFYRKGRQFGPKLQRLVSRRTAWLRLCIMLFLLSVIVQITVSGSSSLVWKFFGPEQAGGIAYSQAFSLIGIRLISTAVFIALTLHLARKRFRLYHRAS